MIHWSQQMPLIYIHAKCLCTANDLNTVLTHDRNPKTYTDQILKSRKSKHEWRVSLSQSITPYQWVTSCRTSSWINDKCINYMQRKWQLTTKGQPWFLHKLCIRRFMMWLTLLLKMNREGCRTFSLSNDWLLSSKTSNIIWSPNIQRP